jgi:valyl-tRNA synthetase
VRSESNVPAGAKIPMRLLNGNAETLRRLAANDEVIRQLARLESIETEGGVPSGSVQIVLGEATVVLPLAGVIDLDAERGRLRSQIKKHEGEIAKIDKKLANADFMAKAPEHVIDEQRERRDDADKTRAKLAEALDRLSAAS